MRCACCGRWDGRCSVRCLASTRCWSACAAFGRPEIPVDTHVFRVGKRLGLFRERASFAEAHDEIRRMVDPEDGYEVHINLIRHGRALTEPVEAPAGASPDPQPTAA